MTKALALSLALATACAHGNSSRRDETAAVVIVGAAVLGLAIVGAAAGHDDIDDCTDPLGRCKNDSAPQPYPAPLPSRW